MLFIAIWNGPSDLIPQFKNIDTFFFQFCRVGLLELDQGWGETSVLLMYTFHFAVCTSSPFTQFWYFILTLKVMQGIYFCCIFTDQELKFDLLKWLAMGHTAGYRKVRSKKRSGFLSNLYSSKYYCLRLTYPVSLSLQESLPYRRRTPASKECMQSFLH